MQPYQKNKTAEEPTPMPANNFEYPDEYNSEEERYNRMRGKQMYFARKLRKLIKPNQKIHISPHPIDGFVDVKKQVKEHKPRGLWYSCGAEWLDWVFSNPDYFSNYIYELNVDLSNVLVISDLQRLIDFEKQYAADSFTYRGKSIIMSIDWPEVAKKYGGIEISPQDNAIRFWRIEVGQWYSGWDVASGCIWERSVLRGFNLLSDLSEEPPETGFKGWLKTNP